MLCVFLELQVFVVSSYPELLIIWRKNADSIFRTPQHVSIAARHSHIQNIPGQIFHNTCYFSLMLFNITDLFITFIECIAALSFSVEFAS